MYNIFPFIVAVIFFGLGIYMIVNPKAATKECFRNDSDKIKKTKTSGFLMLVLGLVMAVIGFINM